MSIAAVSERLRPESMATSSHRVRAILFGDRNGELVFLACLCLFGFVWRTDILITDTYTLVNGLYSLSNGELFLTEAAYGTNLDTPGTTQTENGRIARNYGAIVLSLPIWALLEGLSMAVDLRVGLVGLWSLALLAFVVGLGNRLDNDNIVVVGSVCVLALFGVNVTLAYTLDPTDTHLYALQLFHMLVAAFAPVFLYRLLARIETRQTALLGATLLILGTPLALWASVPKRHVITGTVVLTIAYALYRSRVDADGVLLSHPLTFRALAYVAVGLYTWIHAPEALLLFVVLLAVDVPTAPDNSLRTLAVVGAAFLLSLVPFFLTNIAISGSPIQPPRLLAAQGGAGSQVSAEGGKGGSSVFFEFLSPLLSVVGKITQPFQLLAGELLKGVVMFYTQPDAVYHTVVRSGDAAGALNISGAESVNLTLLESAPVLAGVVGGLSGVYNNWRGSWNDTAPRTVVDLFVGGVIVTLTLLFASRLPIHAQITVRYLFALFPLGVYLLFRVPAVKRSLVDNWRLFAWTTAVTTLIGGQLLAVAVHVTVIGIGAAFQLHAVVALAGAVPLAVWSLLGRSDGRFGQAGAVLLGTTTAMSLLFVLFVAVEYYSLGNSHLLPMVRAVGEPLDLP